MAPRIKVGSQYNWNPTQGWGNRVYGSQEEAIKNRSTRYLQITPNPDNTKPPTTEVMVLTPSKVTGVKNTWQLGVKPESQIGKSLRKHSGNRVEYGQVSTLETNDEVIANKKVGVINRRGQQYHHMLGLARYAPFFSGLSEPMKLALTVMFNQYGFYPGDDRRNYVGLVGSNVAIGSEHQGDIHPRIDKNPIDYTGVKNMNVWERFTYALPFMMQDRDQLREVIKSRRRSGLKANSAGITHYIPEANLAQKVGRGFAKIVSPGAAGLSAFGDVDESVTRYKDFQNDPTIMNAVQFGTSAVVSLANGISAYRPNRVTEIIGAGAEALLLGTDIAENYKEAANVLQSNPRPTSQLMP